LPLPLPALAPPFEAEDMHNRFINLGAPRVAAMIASAEAHGCGHALPLLRWMGAGRGGLIFMPRGADAVDLRAFERLGLPAVVVVQDDDHANTGPAGFPAARKALRWARGLVIHASRGEPWHYAATASLAEELRAVVLVETGTEHAEPWADLARRAALLRGHIGFMLLPRSGAHPILPGRPQ
jgi:hypothetical protein